MGTATLHVAVGSQQLFDLSEQTVQFDEAFVREPDFLPRGTDVGQPPRQGQRIGLDRRPEFAVRQSQRGRAGTNGGRLALGGFGIQAAGDPFGRQFVDGLGPPADFALLRSTRMPALSSVRTW